MASKYNWQNIKGLGLGIVAFEATEHLVNIISEIRDCVDYVVVGLQRKSYHGDDIDPIDLQEIFRLRDEDHLVDEILEIELDTTKAPRVQETDKRNLLIDNISAAGCSHALIIDSDEYYTKSSFLKALCEIDKNNYEITYCQYINYYRDYRFQLVYPFQEGMYVPFVTKVNYKFNFESQDFSLPSDPTRRYVRPYDNLIPVFDKNNKPVINSNTGKQIMRKHYTVDYYIFPWNIVKMHHLSCIRANIRKKFNDWSSKTCFDNYNDLIDKAVDAYNNFDTNSNEEQWAHLLFNTPDHKVKVHAFPKQYIFPKYDINTRLRPVKSYKKIAIMDLSTTNSKCHLFEELDKCCKETWAKDVIDGKYPNIDYWSVIDCDGNSYISEETKTIYIKTDYSKSNVQQLLNRWLEAYKLLAFEHNYDWVLRTNTSTWCNIDVLNEFLAYETDDSTIYTFKLMAAFWSTFNMYCSGAAMLWPTRNIQILDKLVAETSEDVLEKALDDVMMSALWRNRAQTIKLADPDKCFHSLEGQYLNKPFEDTEWDKVDLTVPIYQIKTFLDKDNNDIKDDENQRLINDISKMKKLQELWEQNIEDYNIEELAKNLRENKLDKTITIMPYSKQEWLSDNLTENDKINALFNTKQYNQKTIDWLEETAKACGYKHLPKK